MSACDQHRVIHDKYSRENININVTPDNCKARNVRFKDADSTIDALDVM